MDTSGKVQLAVGWQRRVTDALSRVRPDLGDGALRPLNAGLENLALLWESGGRSLVLRFPQTADGAEGLLVEERLLPELAPRLPIPVPQFAFTAPNPLGPGRFCAYPPVPGEPLTAAQWHARGLVEADEPAHQVADVITAVHAFPVDRARQLGVPDWDPQACAAEDLPQIRAEVAPLLDPPAARRLLDSWEAFLAEPAHAAYTPTLLHADLALNHLLVTGPRVSGLIDFGDVTISDPDYDLSYLWAEATPGFVRRVQQHRGLELSESQVAKLRFWTLADPASDVLHGIENDLPDFRDRALQRLTERLARTSDARRHRW